MELDLTKVAGLGLEVDWADGKTLFIKSVKVGKGGYLQVDSTSSAFSVSGRRKAPCLPGTRSTRPVRWLPVIGSFRSMERQGTRRQGRGRASDRLCAPPPPSTPS